MENNELLHFTKVEFFKFKAFKHFRLDLKKFNILVGPNNAGKSTVLAAFRILASAIRKAEARKATIVNGPSGPTMGYAVDMNLISVASENIFYNYDDEAACSVVFTLSNKYTLTLYFPGIDTCYLLPDADGKNYHTPNTFKKIFNCSIGFVPILGPVEHYEPLYEKEAARLALFSYQAARNFRNIWYHYPDDFEEFENILQQTWPGMDVSRPEIDRSHSKPRLNMYCPESRIPREIFWSGFGFQVWCQMLTHVIKSKKSSIFLIDEPDIYLHSDLQRQLLAILRDLGPDIVLATHSTEMIMEAETDDILLINKTKSASKRIREPAQISAVLNALGSNINPILTQLAKTKRVLFVEGKDFQIISKFARKLGFAGLANRRDFAVVQIEGFNPEKMKNLKAGMEATLGTPIVAAAILDKDFRSQKECEHVKSECSDFCEYVTIHKCKELENFLLIPEAINRCALQKLEDREKRGGVAKTSAPNVLPILDKFCMEKKNYVTSQSLVERKRYDRLNPSGHHESRLRTH